MGWVRTQLEYHDLRSRIQASSEMSEAGSILSAETLCDNCVGDVGDSPYYLSTFFFSTLRVGKMTYMTYRCHQLTLSGSNVDRKVSLIHQTDHSIDQSNSKLTLKNLYQLWHWWCMMKASFDNRIRLIRMRNFGVN